MNKFDLVIKSDKVFIDGRLIDCWIGVKDGIISTISKEKLTAEKIIDAIAAISVTIKIGFLCDQRKIIKLTDLKAFESVCCSFIKQELICLLHCQKYK